MRATKQQIKKLQSRWVCDYATAKAAIEARMAMIGSAPFMAEHVIDLWFTAPEFKRWQSRQAKKLKK